MSLPAVTTENNDEVKLCPSSTQASTAGYATDPMKMELNGTPFSVLVGQAARLKSARDEPDRSKYVSFPTFYQNSIFHQKEVIEARAGRTFEGRIEAAMALKEER